MKADWWEMKMVVWRDNAWVGLMVVVLGSQLVEWKVELWARLTVVWWDCMLVAPKDDGTVVLWVAQTVSMTADWLEIRLAERWAAQRDSRWADLSVSCWVVRKGCWMAVSTVHLTVVYSDSSLAGRMALWKAA